MQRQLWIGVLVVVALAGCRNPDPDRLEISVVGPKWEWRMPRWDFRVPKVDFDLTLDELALEVDAQNLGTAQAATLWIEGEIVFHDADGTALVERYGRVEVAPTGTEPPPPAFAADYAAGTMLAVWDDVQVVRVNIPDGASTLTLAGFADPVLEAYPPGMPFYFAYGNYWETPSDAARAMGRNNSERNNGRETQYEWTEAGGGDGVWHSGEAGDWEQTSSRVIRTEGGL